MTVYTIEGQKFVFSNCITCGVSYSVPEPMWNKQQEKGGFHHCCNGHSQGWDKEDSGIEILRRERNRLKQQAARLKDESRTNLELARSNERTAAAYKGQVTKLKKRAKHGVCPCCNRSFQNLARHMESRHPNFDPEAPLKVIEGGKQS